jgi:RNA polymerase sigma factor (sigma-70 family)
MQRGLEALETMLAVSNISPAWCNLLYEMIELERYPRRTLVLGDAELVKAAQNGDAVSLGIVLERHRAPLYALALRLLGHGPQAQDAVQDSFLIALSSIDRLREPGAVGGWLRGIVRNVCLMRLREERKVHFGDVAARLDREFSESSTEEAIDQLALREWVWTALGELPEVLKVTAMLRYFGSYASYEEISAILGVPVGTVKSRLNQVKAKLAEALLKTAGLAHDEARRVTETQARYFESAIEDFNRKQDHEMFVSAFAEDLAEVFSNGSIRRGRALLIAELEGDLEAGIKLHPTNVLASKEVTVVEADFENPPDDPFHCPPATSMVFFYSDGQIHRSSRYFTPHSQKRSTSEKRSDR